MTTEEKYYLDLLIKNALTVNSDEMEGQQVIDLNNLDLCAVDYDTIDTIDTINDATVNPSLSDMDILGLVYADNDFMKLLITDPEDLPEVIKDIDTSSRVIIEFADATIKDSNPVDYSFNIKPGESINNDTIFGTVKQEGKMKTMKSIFSKGTVMGVNDNLDYYRLYPSKCDRHYILDNTLIGDGNDFNISDKIVEVSDKFKNEGLLYALITNNLCQSLLPYVLSHRYRGIYKRHKYFYNGVNTYGKWYLDTSDASYDLLDTSTFIRNTEFDNNKEYNTSVFVKDTYNDSLPTGVTIYDTSILKFLDDIQDDFGAKMIGSDITKDEMKSWKKRAKKKRKRKKVKQEIKEKTSASTDKIKHSDNPYNTIKSEGDRLLNARLEYIDKVILLYNDKDKLPLCKWDPDYTDCKFLVQDNIDSNVLNNAKSYDSDFTYNTVGDTDTYYNYYFSLLDNINLLGDSDDQYTLEYYLIITDIINKRLIVEGTDASDMKLLFMKLFNNNVSKIFNIYANDKYNTEYHINTEFNKFEGLVNSYVTLKTMEYSTNISEKYKDLNLDDEAIANAGTYSAGNRYLQIYNYISSLYKFDSDEDSDAPNEIVSLLATMYTYIKSYGDGSSNKYKNLQLNDKYLYLGLVLEEAKKITDFWDKIIKLYNESTMTNCMDALNNLAYSFEDYAIWPVPTLITINNIEYDHYLFENIYPRDSSTPIDISIGDYAFPEEIEFPDIPDEYPVDENWALDLLNSHEQQEPDDPNVITFLDTDYWRKYFALATLICLVPTFWNCGLDIMPFIQMIPLPCIFICITSVYIPMFNLLIVFGIAIRGMYPWPIILYLNTSDQPISVLTPLIAVLDLLKDVFYKKINQIEQIPIQSLVNLYITKLNNEINDIKKENIKLDNFKKVCKNLKVPKATSIKEEFSKIVDPSIDTRLRIQRIETLAKKNRVKN